MGIKGLTALIQEHAPKAIKVRDASCRSRIISKFIERCALSLLMVLCLPSLPPASSFLRVCIQEHDIKTLFGRKVAIDASMSIYQFLIAVRQRDGEVLQNEAGETTSHLMGFFYRTIRMVENGIKPCYVFDGKPPELKSGVVSIFRCGILDWEEDTMR